MLDTFISLVLTSMVVGLSYMLVSCIMDLTGAK
jgi:hypothetical protein